MHSHRAHLPHLYSYNDFYYSYLHCPIWRMRMLFHEISVQRLRLVFALAGDRVHIRWRYFQFKMFSYFGKCQQQQRRNEKI